MASSMRSVLRVLGGSQRHGGPCVPVLRGFQSAGGPCVPVFGGSQRHGGPCVPVLRGFQSAGGPCVPVLGGSQRHGGPSMVARRVLTRVPSRSFAAQVKIRKGKKLEATKKKEAPVKTEPDRAVVMDDKDRHKPYGKVAWFPVDDVYINRFYPRDVHRVGVALDLLSSFQRLDFTPPDQPVLLDLKLDMTLQKKKKVDPFVSTVQLPHPIKKDTNRVIVFTEDPDQVKVAQEGGAAAVGGAELVQQILEDVISADFYVAVPEILPKLLPLKNKLRKKFPKTKRGSVGIDIPKMMAVFMSGHEYAVERDCYVVTQIGTMDMPREKLLQNLQAVVVDVCKHRPDTYGNFIERSIISSQTSEAVWFKSEDVLPPPPENDKPVLT